MQSRKEMHIKPIMQAYNILMIGINAYIGYEVLIGKNIMFFLVISKFFT